RAAGPLAAGDDADGLVGDRLLPVIGPDEPVLRLRHDLRGDGEDVSVPQAPGQGVGGSARAAGDPGVLRSPGILRSPSVPRSPGILRSRDDDRAQIVARTDLADALERDDL